MSQSGPANAVPTLLRSECAYLEARSSSVASVSRESWAATDKELRLASRRSWSTPSCALPVPCQYIAAWNCLKDRPGCSCRTTRTREGVRARQGVSNPVLCEPCCPVNDSDSRRSSQLALRVSCSVTCHEFEFQLKKMVGVS